MATTGSSPSREAIEGLGSEVVRLHRATHLLRSQLATGAPDSLEWAAYVLLFQLVREGPRRSSALADAACVDPSTVSRQVGQLVDLGLVERRADPVDGRASLLVATEAGEATYASMQERRHVAFAKVLTDWPDEHVHQLAALLHRLNNGIITGRGSVAEALSVGAPTTGAGSERARSVEENS